MGAPDSPVRATSAQPLGFGVGRSLEPLSSCCTGQSGATPDSPVPSDFCALTSPRHCSTLFLLTKRPLVHRESLLRWLTGQSGGTPDSPVNYSGARLQIPESGWFGVVRPWCTGHCPVTHRTVRCTIFQQTQVLCSIFYRVPNWISFLVCVESYAPVIHEFLIN
jgi:hypothetical protein